MGAKRVRGTKGSRSEKKNKLGEWGSVRERGGGKVKDAN